MIKVLLFPQVSLLYAGLLGLFYFFLSTYVILYRWKERKGMGYNNDPASGLFRAVRIHGNFMEYVPLIILLLVLDEMTGRSSVVIHSLGGSMILARLAHFWGIKQTDGPSPARTLGVGITFLTLIILSLNLILKVVL